MSTRHRPNRSDLSKAVFTIPEIAELAKVSEWVIRRIIRYGELKVIYIGKRQRRIPRAEALRFLGFTPERAPGPMVDYKSLAAGERPEDAA